MYVLNDLSDRAHDRLHPVKRARPVASGRISPAVALALAGMLVVAAGLGLAWPWPLPVGVSVSIGLYVAVQLAYSSGLKRVVILDGLLIAIGFLLRATAGVFAVQARLSEWLLVCGFLVSFFLALAKRRGELAAVGAEPGQRPVLEQYSLGLLDQMISISASIAILSYILYTVDERTQRQVHPDLIYTSPMVLFGILRYLYLVHRCGAGESPEESLLCDPSMVATFVAWCVAVLLLLYGFPGGI